MRRTRIYSLLWPVLSALSIPHLGAADTFRIIAAPNFTETSPSYDLVLQAYSRLGINISIENLPAARSIKEVSDGRADAELARVEELGYKSFALIRIQEPVGELRVALFVKQHTIVNIPDWKALETHKVDTIRGFKLAESKLGEKANYESSAELIMRRLLAERSYVAVLPYDIGMEIIKDPRYASIILLNANFDRAPLYHYVARKHATLAMRLNEQFICIKAKTCRTK